MEIKNILQIEIVYFPVILIFRLRLSHFTKIGEG
jgi:hypothetical protein